MLQVLSDERLHNSSGGGGGAENGSMVPEETGYSMAFIMDPWTHPTSDEAKVQSVDIPVRSVTGCFWPMSAMWACNATTYTHKHTHTHTLYGSHVVERVGLCFTRL